MSILDNSINLLELDSNINKKLFTNNISLVKDLWLLNRSNLKEMNFNSNEINKIIISLQLKGLDLNKKINH